MNLGKCASCNKSVYDIEGLTVGPPGKTVVYHKGCFKCTTCNWQLTLTTYKFWENLPYCKNHYPVTGFGDQNALHVKGGIDTKTQVIENQLNAPKLDTYNQTVRGPADKPSVGLDSMGVSNALNAPKAANLSNPQVRGQN